MIQDARTRMTDQEELDAEQDEILYSTLDYFPGEPETGLSYGAPNKPFFGSKMDCYEDPPTRPGMERPESWHLMKKIL